MARIFFKEIKIELYCDALLKRHHGFFTGISNAQEPLAIPQNKPLIPYVVSAVLRKTDTEAVTKLIQSLQIQASPEAAEQALVDQILMDYSGYVLVTTMVTPVSTLIIPVKPKVLRPLSS